jgi:hypothetical protein
MQEYTELECLQADYSDFYKAYHGYRPRFASPEQWASIEWLTAQMQSISDEMTQLALSFEGREFLRAQGWVIEKELDADMQQKADWLAEERARIEQAEAMAVEEAQLTKYDYLEEIYRL